MQCPTGLKGALEYYDCATDDSRLVVENAIDAIALGADCHTYTEATGFQRNAAGRITGVNVRDRLSDRAWTATCRAVVLAAGAWTDEAIERFQIPIGKRLLRPTSRACTSCCRANACRSRARSR